MSSLGFDPGYIIFHSQISGATGHKLAVKPHLTSPLQTCSVFYLFGSFRAALGAVSSTVSCSWASLWRLGVDVFGHVDVIVQQHLLLQPSSGATGECRGGLSVTRLRQLLKASAAAAPAVSLQASSRLGAATAAVGGQEG